MTGGRRCTGFRPLFTFIRTTSDARKNPENFRAGKGQGANVNHPQSLFTDESASLLDSGSMDIDCVREDPCVTINSHIHIESVIIEVYNGY